MKKCFLCIVMLLIAAIPYMSSLSAETYKWVDEKGTLHLSDTPPQQSQTFRVSENKSIKIEPTQKYSLTAIDRLKSCDSNIAMHAAEEIINNPDTLKEPLDLFAPVFVLFQNGKKDEAVFWFSAAQLRVQYQLAFEKGDRGQLLTVMRMTIGPPILNYAFQDVSNYVRILDRVLEWDKKTPNPFRGKPRSERISKEIAQIYTGLSDYKAKLIAEKSDLEAKARKAAPDIERTYSNKSNPPCREGQLDPAYADQEIKKEWPLVIDFIKNNKEVIEKTKGIKEVYPYTFKRKAQDVLPDKYIVGVHGLDKQPWEKDFNQVYVAVDVSRQDGIAKFSLACFLPSSGHSGPNKIECEK